MVRDGIYYALGFTAAGILISWLLGTPPALPLFLLAIFCAWFFRDPERPIPVGSVAVSPADGKVVAIVNEGNGLTRISIFLNIFDVITDFVYQKGKFLVASVEAASSDNEQTIITVRAQDGTQVVFKQIAGLIARRIIFTKTPGDFVQAGERIGLIKFGSRMDVILGPEWYIEVAQGARVSAGSSILARRGGEVELPLAMKAGLKEPELCRT